MNKNVIVGVDIGGTTVKIGIIKDNGEIISNWEIETRKSEGSTTVIDDIWSTVQNRLIELNMDTEDVLGIGIGAPGFIDGKKGYIYEAVNLGWRNFSLSDHMNQKSGLPVFVENDANIAALGENWLGAGNEAKDVIAVTLGTGVGGGIIVDGTIINGVSGTAGEIGHITVDPNGYQCNCGRKGCLETIASATGVRRQALEVIKKKPNSKLAKSYEVNSDITSKTVFELANTGDEDAINIVQHTADVLGFVLANLANTLNPSMILIGGGMSKAGDSLLQPVKKFFTTYALSRVSSSCEIKLAKLGNNAGIIGAAYLVKQNMN